MIVSEAKEHKTLTNTLVIATPDLSRELELDLSMEDTFSLNEAIESFLRWDEYREAHPEQPLSPVPGEHYEILCWDGIPYHSMDLDEIVEQQYLMEVEGLPPTLVGELVQDHGDLARKYHQDHFHGCYEEHSMGSRGRAAFWQNYIEETEGKLSGWLAQHIDWDSVADEVEADYNCISDGAGTTYVYRS